MAHTTKENRDIYYRKAKEEGYRARSAYKLLQIFESFHILYPILDEESALALVSNTSCQDCEHSSPDEPQNGANRRSESREVSCSGPGAESESDCDELPGYFKVKRSCHSLGRVRNVVDLCSAPGSWSQLLRNLVFHDYVLLKGACEKLQVGRKVCRRLVEEVSVRPAIVAIDLQQMAPLEGVHFLRGDITDSAVLEQVRQLFLENVSKNADSLDPRHPPTSHSQECGEEGSPSYRDLVRNAQLITCDGAPDVSGLHETDSFLQSSLIKSALSLCFCLLDRGGTFVCKTFFSSDQSPTFRHVSAFFDFCTIFKPAASRPSSFEHFIVAMGFKPLGHTLRAPGPAAAPLETDSISNGKKENSNIDLFKSGVSNRRFLNLQTVGSPTG